MANETNAEKKQRINSNIEQFIYDQVSPGFLPFKGTPGEWQIFESKTEFGYETINGRYIVPEKFTTRHILANDSVIITSKHISNNSEEEEANSHIIAAAPELLHALQFCKGVIEKNGCYDTSETMAVRMAYAAIHKALNIK